MAKIRSFFSGSSDLRPHSTEVDCAHQIIQSNGNIRLLQLSTYGSDNRKAGPKVSQTLQLDERAAVELVNIIRDAFPSAF